MGFLIAFSVTAAPIAALAFFLYIYVPVLPAIAANFRARVTGR